MNMTDKDFIEIYILDILDIPGDISSGINGSILKSAYKPACAILKAHGAPKPNIIDVIEGIESDDIYIVENGR